MLRLKELEFISKSKAEDVQFKYHINNKYSQSLHPEEYHPSKINQIFCFELLDASLGASASPNCSLKMAAILNRSRRMLYVNMEDNVALCSRCIYEASSGHALRALAIFPTRGVAVPIMDRGSQPLDQNPLRVKVVNFIRGSRISAIGSRTHEGSRWGSLPQTRITNLMHRIKKRPVMEKRVKMKQFASNMDHQSRPYDQHPRSKGRAEMIEAVTSG